MSIGTCVGCGIDELEINDDGYCVDCAALEGGEVESGAEETTNEEEEA